DYYCQVWDSISTCVLF
nr:immunoglobulin light chain junction region [Macaca mulatta]MOW68223.1 immunoglobulin light chain junction region [Macaca mulatta]MOW71271.1 immunoglobulin light chain junction region [Macaca mulatta]MOW71724.1 immunoglobulin light chain junction region [Macaca mulatta]